MIRIDSAVYILSALLLLILPLNWFFAAVFAGLIHEICHIVILLIFGGHVSKISVNVHGCEIETVNLTTVQQFVSILAGPLGSFGLMIFSNWIPRAAVCGLIHGIFNLLPILPLDGGRLLQFVLLWLIPAKAELVMHVVKRLVCFTVFIFSIFACCWYSCSPVFVFMAGIWNIRILYRKIPCKPSQIGVQ